MKRYLLPFVLLLLAASYVSAQRTFVLTTGVSNYRGNDHDLVKSTRDAKRIGSLYKSKGAITTSLTGKYATRDMILTYIRKIARTATKDDDVVFFFSGHGTSGNSLLTYDSVQTVEACYLKYENLVEELDKCDCRHIICYIDACFSGSAINTMKAWRTTKPNNSKFILFLSSRNTEYSFESSDRESDMGGFFATCLYDGLRGKADANEDRQVTARELHNYINMKVGQLMRYHPQAQHTQLVTSKKLFDTVLMDWRVDEDTQE